MTSPIEEITVKCPKCGREYKDWYRPSVNLELDDFDEEYLDECSSATCPFCQFKVHFDTLIVDENGIFHFGGSE
jgi:hypothetical protein